MRHVLESDTASTALLRKIHITRPLPQAGIQYPLLVVTARVVIREVAERARVTGGTCEVTAQGIRDCFLLQHLLLLLLCNVFKLDRSLTPIDLHHSQSTSKLRRLPLNTLNNPSRELLSNLHSQNLESRQHGGH